MPARSKSTLVFRDTTMDISREIASFSMVDRDELSNFYTVAFLMDSSERIVRRSAQIRAISLMSQMEKPRKAVLIGKDVWGSYSSLMDRKVDWESCLFKFKQGTSRGLSFHLAYVPDPTDYTFWSLKESLLRARLFFTDLAWGEH